MGCILTALLVSLSAGACVPLASVSNDPPPPAEAPDTIPPEPSIEEGPIDPAAEGRAAELLREAREALAAEDHSAARDAAERIVQEFPRASGSVEALLILARATYALESYEQSLSAADRYARRFTPEHRYWGEAVLLQAFALVHLERAGDAFELLLENREGLSPERRDEALELVREHVRSVDTDLLEALVETFPEGELLLAPILTEYAVDLYFLGEDEEARRFAERVRSNYPGEPEEEFADAILSGDVEEVLGSAPMIAALLPASGSPALTEFGELVEEGVRLAVEIDSRSHRLRVGLEVIDDAGDPERSEELARQLEQQGTFGFVGPLLDSSVESALSGLARTVPLISPTARMLPEDAEGVYSLSSIDPNSALLLAQYAGEAGLQRIALVYPRTPEAMEEARIFTEAFRSENVGFVVGIPYPPGQTNFEQTMLEVEDLGADALVLPLGPDEIELFAPQISYYGIDDLGLQLLGTSAWALDDVLADVSPRHTNGVIVATPRDPGGTRPEYEAFTEAYESFFQKSLVSRVPALGYDAAGLLLEALRSSGARGPEELRRALERIRDFPGATGKLSVIDGRIVREHTLVRLEDRAMVPIDTVER